jgi:nicotinamidase-related amidase
MAAGAATPRAAHPGRLWGRHTALLLVDLVNDLEWPDGERMLAPAMAVVEPVLALRRRVRACGGAVIYCNDNFGRWRSDFQHIVERCCAEDARGAPLSRALRPGAEDYFVLKPRHSAFYATVLPPLLAHLGIAQLVLAGIAGDGCVLGSALDAHVRDFPLAVPRDAVASLAPGRNAHALACMELSLGADTRPAAELLGSP